MTRRVLILAHTGREESMIAALEACVQLHANNIVPVMYGDELADMTGYLGVSDVSMEILGRDVSLADIELVMVLGGDGTILRAAELVREHDLPLLGVNLGHVGFLAESERADLIQTVDWVVRRKYSVEERMTLDVKVRVKGKVVAHTWALNEVALEKGNRERMIEVVTEVDGRPLSSFGCDGVVMATPTGSTAYAFSAGGPVVWPEVEALLMVPISAHALFAKPLVVAPTSTLAVEVLTRNGAYGVIWCDGRRTVDLLPGARIEVTRSNKPVKLARTQQSPFSERLVRKFELPVQGWRGPSIEETVPPTSQLPIIKNPKRKSQLEGPPTGPIPQVPDLTVTHHESPSTAEGVAPLHD